MFKKLEEIIVADIWQYEILPYLDWKSRIDLNTVLEPTTRSTKKFTKNDIENHDMITCIEHYTNLMKDNCNMMYNEPLSAEKNYIYINKLLDNVISIRWRNILKFESCRKMMKIKTNGFISYLSEDTIQYNYSIYKDLFPNYLDYCKKIKEKSIIINNLCDKISENFKIDRTPYYLIY
jgi:hypothetical protein